ncbi:MAG TPA: hypothetical protein DCM54_10605 [Gammaproteobacteria bacterium]|nr:hypothetical protein [Gammaproteobacteria bacterium]
MKQKPMNNLLIVGCLALVLSGCAATRSSSKVNANERVTSTEAVQPTLVSEIIMTEHDILDREYEVLGDIKAFVSKTTIFNKDPTNEMVANKRRSLELTQSY